MKAREYKILAQAVEEGVMYGLRRAYKHADSTPWGDDDVEFSRVAEGVVTEVLNSISESFTFEGDEYGGSDNG